MTRIQRRLPPLPVVFLLAALTASPASADTGIGLHVVPRTGTTCTPTIDPYRLRTDMPTLSAPTGPFYDVYVVGCLRVGLGPNAPPAGIGGLEFGINYPGGYAPGGGLSPISVFDWTNCGDLQFPSSNWPAPGSGNLVTWQQARCATPLIVLNNSIAVAGYFYLGAYGPGRISLTVRPASGHAKIANCPGTEYDLTPNASFLGSVGFGGLQGGNGCLFPDPVTSSTWSGIKGGYGR